MDWLHVQGVELIQWMQASFTVQAHSWNAVYKKSWHKRNTTWKIQRSYYWNAYTFIKASVSSTNGKYRASAELLNGLKKNIGRMAIRIYMVHYLQNRWIFFSQVINHYTVLWAFSFFFSTEPEWNHAVPVSCRRPQKCIPCVLPIGLLLFTLSWGQGYVGCCHLRMAKCSFKVVRQFYYEFNHTWLWSLI